MFPGIDSRIKFCLLTIGGDGRRNTAAEFAFFLHRAGELADADSRRFQISPADFALFSPNTGNCPVFRSRRDMEISRKMYERAGVLWQEEKGAQGAKKSTLRGRQVPENVRHVQ